jgi:predicted PurR-regulated permease PerM
MYCSTCGNEIKTELNYCNRCGARVDKTGGGDNSGASYLSMATGFVCLGGLGLTVGLIAMLLRNNVAPTVIVILALAFLCAVFGISVLMIQQISRMTKSLPGEKISDRTNPAQLDAINTAQLNEYRQPAHSVTENTTRTLDKTKV